MKTTVKLRVCVIRLLCMAGAIMAIPAVAQNPVAKQEAIVTVGNARFTVLTPEMIRIEYSDMGRFEDRKTFTIQNREMDVPTFTKTEDNTYLYIETDKLKLKYRKGTNPKTVPASPENLTVTMTHKGQSVSWYPGKPDPLNLKGTCRTLDGSNDDNKRSELEDGLISRSGWAVIDDSWTAARPDGSRSYTLEQNQDLGYDWWSERKDPHALDLYFMGYGTNYKKALSDFTKVAGKIPLPPDYVFGYWYSRYASYTDEDYLSIMAELEKNDIPTDVMILDMDWHWNGDGNCGSAGRGGWTGWSWNTNLITDPVKLLSDIHGNDMRLSLNLHPADGIDRTESPQYYGAMKSELNGKYDNGQRIEWSLDFPDFTKSFFKNIIRDHENEGVDFWWIDWQQWLTSPKTQGLGQTFWCNHVFFNDMKTNRADRRPVIFHRWGGLGSHRYQIGFSGDALINFPTLAFQPYFTATASNVGYAYWGHDLGGHAFTDVDIVNDPELFLRWIQFGVFTPIFRSHATKDERIERRMWKFSNFPLMRDAVKLRYALFPYIYTMARKTYDTGLGICRPLYYDYPDDEEAYKYEDEYFYGDNILVAPITEAAADGKTSFREIWFPKGQWWSVATNQLIEGPCVMTMQFTEKDIPYFYKAGSITPLNPASVKRVTTKPTQLLLDIVAGFEGKGSLYEDEGDNSDYDTQYAMTDFKHTVNGNFETYIIEPREGVQTDLVQSRSWILNILNAGTPVEIKINGVKAEQTAWEYNAEGKKLTIRIPEATCNNRQEVVVEYDKTGGITEVLASDVKMSYDRVSDTFVADLGMDRKNVSLSIMNIAGVECVKKDYSDISHITESMSELSPATYICRLIADKKQYISKISK